MYKEKRLKMVDDIRQNYITERTSTVQEQLETRVIQQRSMEWTNTMYKKLLSLIILYLL